MQEAAGEPEKAAQPVDAPGKQTAVAVETTAAEVTQAKRRLQRALWSAKIEARIRAEAEGVSVKSMFTLTTPMLRDLDKLYREVENFQLAYNLTDEEIEE